VQDSRADLTKQESATANPEPNVQLTLSTEDAETLLKLQDAGLVDLDGLDELGTENPKLTDWTYEGFRQHMLGVQDLAESTTRERVKYIRYLEDHEGSPVELRPPREGSWLEHVTYRRRYEDVTGAALNHYRKSLKSLLRFLELDIWECLNSRYKESSQAWTLPPDDLVPRFWTDVDHLRANTRSDYLAHTYAYVFHFGFHTGVRPPSEIAHLDVGDVDLDNPRIIVSEEKKNNRRVLEDVPAYVMTAGNAKSLRLYLEHWRPRVDQGKTDALFLNSKGERFNKTALGNQLSKIGKTLWPDFKPYTMRRWFATQLLISSGFNVYVVAEKIGDKVSTVEDHYLERAKARSKMGDEHHIPRLMGGGSRDA
jgi:integrase